MTKVKMTGKYVGIGLFVIVAVLAMTEYARDWQYVSSDEIGFSTLEIQGANFNYPAGAKIAVRIEYEPAVMLKGITTEFFNPACAEFRILSSPPPCWAPKTFVEQLETAVTDNGKATLVFPDAKLGIGNYRIKYVYILEPITLNRISLRNNPELSDQARLLQSTTAIGNNSAKAQLNLVSNYYSLHDTSTKESNDSNHPEAADIRFKAFSTVNKTNHQSPWSEVYTESLDNGFSIEKFPNEQRVSYEKSIIQPGNILHTRARSYTFDTNNYYAIVETYTDETGLLFLRATDTIDDAYETLEIYLEDGYPILLSLEANNPHDQTSKTELFYFEDQKLIAAGLVRNAAPVGFSSDYEIIKLTPEVAVKAERLLRLTDTFQGDAWKTMRTFPW